MYKIFIVSSVSGSGKTTLVNHAVKELNLYKLKTCTTRAVRREEKGNEYYFISKDEFKYRIQEDEFIEYAMVYGEYYGLLKKEVEENKDKNCIIILDVQGMKTFTKLYPQAITIFIKPAPREELIKRLKERSTNQTDLNNRIKDMNYEITQMDYYYRKIEYGDLDTMKTAFLALISKLIN